MFATVAGSTRRPPRPGEGRCLVALEGKPSATVQNADVRHLLWLKDRLGGDLVDMAVVTTGRHA
jgi:hypothetical protein